MLKLQEPFGLRFSGFIQFRCFFRRCKRIYSSQIRVLTLSYHQISTVHVKIMITSQWCLIREIFPSYCRRIFAFMDRRIASIIQWRGKLQRANVVMVYGRGTEKCRLIRKYTIVSNATKGTTARYTTSKKIKKQCKKLSRF